MLVFVEGEKPENPEKNPRSKDENQQQTPQPTYDTRGPFLETPDNFPGPVSIFSSSFIYQLMVIIGANLAICFTQL